MISVPQHGTSAAQVTQRHRGSIHDQSGGWILPFQAFPADWSFLMRWTFDPHFDRESLLDSPWFSVRFSVIFTSNECQSQRAEFPDV